MQRIVRVNFLLSVLFSVIGGVVVLFKPDLLFSEMALIHGPLSRNLLLIILYLVAIQFVLWMFRYRKTGYLEALFMGGLFLMAAIGIPFYCRVNGIPLSMSLVTALIYCGFSHVIYFADAYLRLKEKPEGNNRYQFK